MNIATTIQSAERLEPDPLTEKIVSKLGNPETTSDFDFGQVRRHPLPGGDRRQSSRSGRLSVSSPKD